MLQLAHCATVSRAAFLNEVEPIKIDIKNKVQPAPVPKEEDDGFGDFGDFEETPAPAQVAAPV